VLLGGPTALAFFSGGYFDEARLWAAIVAFALVLVATAACDVPLPASWAGRISLAGLGALAGWTALSISWAPLAGPAFHDLQRLLLYLAALTAAAAFLRGAAPGAALEPALAAGALLVIGYGVSERLLPGLVHLDHSLSAAGRLEQPLTYWNATGALGAIGLILCARLTGDPARRDLTRALAAAAAALLGLGVYLSFSRGALAALGAGILVLGLLIPTREQLRGIALSVAAGAIASAGAALMPAVRSLHGSLPTREREGALMLFVLVLVAAGAAAAAWWSSRAERQGRLATGQLRWLRRGPALAAVAALVLAGAVAVARTHEKTTAAPARGAITGRLGSIESNRYAYWKVAGHMFVHHPLRGEGSGSFRVEWLRRRTVPEAAQDAHSLYIETAAELGLAGVAALVLFLGGAAAAARRAYLLEPSLTAGWIAAASVWLVHAGLDWDWEMPAVSLTAIVLTGALISRSEQPARVSARPAEPAPAPAPQPRPTPAGSSDS
jgi:hypothetical protein